MFLKQGAATTIILGPFIDDTDGKTAETALTIAQADVQLSKNGGAYAQKNSATACSHLTLGNYSCALNATDTGTLGFLRVNVHKAGALPVWRDFMVMPANVWDSLFGADKLETDVTQWLGTAVATPATAGYPVVINKVGTGTGELSLTGGKVELVDNAVNANTVATNAIDAAALASDAITEIQAGLPTAAALAVLQGDVDNLMTLLTPTRIAYLDELSSGVPSTGGIAGAVWDEVLSGHLTAGSAGEALGDAGGGSIDVAEIVAAVWDAILSEHLIAGSAGKALSDAQDGDFLGGSSTAAENLRDGAAGLRRGTATVGTLSTTQMTTNVTGLPADVVVGRLVTFIPPGALQYQQRRIVDYVAANGLITVESALTQAVPNGQTFVIQ